MKGKIISTYTQSNSSTVYDEEDPPPSSSYLQSADETCLQKEVRHIAHTFRVSIPLIERGSPIRMSIVPKLNERSSTDCKRDFMLGNESTRRN